MPQADQPAAVCSSLATLLAGHRCWSRCPLRGWLLRHLRTPHRYVCNLRHIPQLCFMHSSTCICLCCTYLLQTRHGASLLANSVDKWCCIPAGSAARAVGHLGIQRQQLGRRRGSPCNASALAGLVGRPHHTRRPPGGAAGPPRRLPPGALAVRCSAVCLRSPSCRAALRQPPSMRSTSIFRSRVRESSLNGTLDGKTVDSIRRHVLPAGVCCSGGLQLTTWPRPWPRPALTSLPRCKSCQSCLMGLTAVPCRPSRQSCVQCWQQLVARCLPITCT
jgi:hypothetical protein